RKQARAVDKHTGHRPSPLSGVPVVIKDSIQVRGSPTAVGSKIWGARNSTVTAELVQQLMSQGLIIRGKTHMVEFAFGGWGTNELLGTPRNPWDNTVHRTPGGSSSGSAFAVSAQMAPLAIGTD